ncbi:MULTISPECIES: GntR family transcriptional regulator [Rathayibacter]|uniref:GntR family transcriptional regulator n=1 Tax=Rathayibacter TaxID=33886 RepID=UPI001E2D481F|nr:MULTISPECIES: GntR family transcriptional regulator [Rathayibacter]MCJ1696080.1 GntR family transcriptional regulator [Rathayibacter caricis]
MASRSEPAARAASARDRTVDALRRRIISLDLQPGSPLSENELSAELGISRTPVRESLLLLKEEGLVQIFPQRGSFVSRVDPERVAQAQFIREAIECASLAQVAAESEVDPAGLAALHDILDDQREADAEEDVERFFRLDEDFHRALLDLSGHGSAWNAVNSAKAHLDRARRLSLVDARPIHALIDQHAAVVDAIGRGDGDGAVAALRSHLRAVFDDVERIRRGSPELFSDGSDLRVVRRTVSELA